MQNFQDFIKEPTSTAILMTELSKIGTPTISALFIPKFHCEIAGEGIELNWGLSKKKFRNVPFQERKEKVKFQKSVKDSIEYIKQNIQENFRVLQGDIC